MYTFVAGMVPAWGGGGGGGGKVLVQGCIWIVKYKFGKFDIVLKMYDTPYR